MAFSISFIFFSFSFFGLLSFPNSSVFFRFNNNNSLWSVISFSNSAKFSPLTFIRLSVTFSVPTCISPSICITWYSSSLIRLFISFAYRLFPSISTVTGSISSALTSSLFNKNKLAIITSFVIFPLIFI